MLTLKNQELKNQKNIFSLNLVEYTFLRIAGVAWQVCSNNKVYISKSEIQSCAA